jgi:hypothetical protein
MTIQQAIEITKAAIPMQNGSWLSNPKQVAKFVEVLANKINNLSQSKS